MLARTGAEVVEVEVEAVVGGAVAATGPSGALHAASANTRTIGAVIHLYMRGQYRPQRSSGVPPFVRSARGRSTPEAGSTGATVQGFPILDFDP